MNFIKRVWGVVTGAGYLQPGLQIPFPPVPISAQQEVDTDKALQISAVFACVRLISETVSTLSPRVYTIGEGGKRTLATDHPVNRLMSGKANTFQTGQEFLELMAMQLCLQGNAYALKQKNGNGDLVGLVPMMADQMQVTLTDGNQLLYQYTAGGVISRYKQEDIWHVKLMGNGAIGISPLQYARTSFGIGIAAEKTVAKLFANGAKPAGVLMVDQLLKPEQRAKIKESLYNMANGSESNFFVLEANMKYNPISLTPEDIELLASRRFQIEDIARFFGVPSVLINDLSATSSWGSGIHEIVQGWYKLGLRPYLVRIATSAKTSLFTLEERSDHELIFDLDPLLQVGRIERYQGHREGIMAGFLSINEARRVEGLEPKVGGDELRMQKQMVSIDSEESFDE